MSRLSQIIIILLWYLPLVCIPYLPLGFETPKVLVFELSVLIIATIIIFNNSLKLNNPLKILVGSVILLSLYTLIFHNSATVLFNNPVRLQGLFLQGILVLWVIICANLPFTKFQTKLPLISLVILVISGFIFQEPITGRGVGLIGEPNSFAGMSVLLFSFILLGNDGSSKSKWIRASSLCFVSIMVLLSGSRSALLALLLVLFVSITLNYWKLSYCKTTIIACIFFSISLLLPFLTATNSWEDRVQIWQTAAVAGLDHPLLGNGFGNITAALKNSSHSLQNQIEYQYVDSSHNIFLDWWVQGGIMGMVTFCSIIIFSFRTFIHKKMKLEFVLLWGSLLILSFNPVSITILAIFWWLVGRGFSSQGDA